MEFYKRKEEIRKLEEELYITKREHKAHVVDVVKASKDKFKELQVKSISLHAELHNEQTTNATIMQRIATLEKQCEDETASATSSAFSRFSQ